MQLIAMAMEIMMIMCRGNSSRGDNVHDVYEKKDSSVKNIMTKRHSV